MSVLDEFRRKTQLLFSMGTHSPEEIENHTRAYLNNLFTQAAFNYELGEIIMFGPRTRNCNLINDICFSIFAEIYTDDDTTFIQNVITTSPSYFANTLISISPIFLPAKDKNHQDHTELERKLADDEQFMCAHYSSDKYNADTNYANMVHQVNHLHFHRMLTTSDKWPSPYSDNQIKIELQLFPPEYYDDDDPSDAYSVQIWAHDDEGQRVSLWQSFYDQTEAFERFIHWKRYIYNLIPEQVSLDWFYQHGFAPD